MTAVLDLHPDPGHPGAVVAVVHEALDGLSGVELAPHEYADIVQECARARSRLQALELRLVAAAERARVPQQSGAWSAGAWLASRTRAGQARSARDAALAQKLHDTLPTTASAFAAGEVSAEHASVIADATGQLPSGLAKSEVAIVEERLVENARTLDPQQLRRVARRAIEAVEQDPARVDAHEDALLREEEERALRRTRLTLHDHGDGTTSGHFTVPTLAASMLRRVLDSITAPRRARLGATRAQAGPGATGRDPAHDRGLTLIQVLEHLPTDRLHAKVAATVVVTLDVDTLRGQARAAGLDTGDLLSASEARRLACGAGLVPAVLDGSSQPLDLGRSKRLFTEAQRTAGAITHTSCAADGCDVPYAWCELHHRRPWSRGGRTDLRDLQPLCGFHHRRVHDPGYRHRPSRDGRVQFVRRT